MTQRTEDSVVQEIEEGNIKEASARISIAAGGTESFVIKTPSNEDVKASILSYTISNTASMDLDFYDGVSISTNGTALNINNSKSGEPNSTPLVFEYGGSYSGGTKNGEDLLPAGVKSKAAGARSTDIRRVVSNGTAVRYEFTNKDTSNAQELAVKIIFYEKSVN